MKNKIHIDIFLLRKYIIYQMCKSLKYVNQYLNASIQINNLFLSTKNLSLCVIGWSTR
ncbi:unnamed protein product [Spodoptera exigua]|nr:unnamed protein product [Spodoptera exigua]